ncbi:16S rRNA (guanine(527)-N(7))-methyltransferase RsmG [Vallitaleaceae bacterium 9-2]
MDGKTKIIQELEQPLKALNIQLNAKQEEQICHYYEKLKEWNAVMNLTAIVDEVDFAQKHVVDSITSAKFYDFSKIDTVIDLGTGAGLPGIPLKIVFPHLQMTLVDSLNKRINFLNELIDELGLVDIVAIHGRAEEVGKDPQYREQFDCCVSRAVSQLAVLSEYCIPFVKVDGCFIAYKSVNTEEEIKDAEYAIETLGATIHKIEDIDLYSGQMPRRFVFIDKKVNTQERYPRRAGVPQKKPLLKS